MYVCMHACEPAWAREERQKDRQSISGQIMFLNLKIMLEFFMLQIQYLRIFRTVAWEFYTILNQ